MTAAPQSVYDVTEADFKRDVVDASFQRPVIVDFWAPWCAPCRELGPVLERLATEAGGQLLLVKGDTHPQAGIAEALRVHSIPAVSVLLYGLLASQVMGARPEEQNPEWTAK